MRLTLTPTRLVVLAMGVVLAGCDGERSVSISSTDEGPKAKGVLRVVDTLQCPETQGELTRKGAATDGGAVCWYVGPRGATIQLRLVKLDGRGAPEVLAPFEAELRRDLPRQTGPERTTPSGTAVDVATDGDRASVDLPGISIEAEGDTADVRIGGFQIQARDGDASVKSGEPGAEAVSVQAGADGAEVRVRAAGEATRVTWMLTDGRDEAPGWRLVGYEARGPVGGPLVVALVRSKDEDKDQAFDDAVDLVSLNVGD